MRVPVYRGTLSFRFARCSDSRASLLARRALASLFFIEDAAAKENYGKAKVSRAENYRTLEGKTASGAERAKARITFANGLYYFC
jgi:hypothetical protein